MDGVSSRVFLLEPELCVGNNIVRIAERDDIFVYDNFKNLAEVWCEADGSIAGRFAGVFIFLEERKNFRPFPTSRKVEIV